VGVETTDDGDELLIISGKGLGKRTKIAEYPVHGRGGQGVKTLNITDRTGDVAACRVIKRGQELMVVTRDGVVTRIARLDTISLLGRNTQGVKVMDVGEGDAVASIAAFMQEDRPERPAAEIAASNGNGHVARASDLVEGTTIPLALDDGAETNGDSGPPD
jgi:DNA gyrase subunit A